MNKKTLYILAVLFVLALVAFATAQLVKARAYDTLQKVEILKDDGQPFSTTLSPNIFSGSIEYENATCYFVSSKEYLTRLENLSQILPLGCVAK